MGVPLEKAKSDTGSSDQAQKRTSGYHVTEHHMTTKISSDWLTLATPASAALGNGFMVPDGTNLTACRSGPKARYFLRAKSCGIKSFHDGYVRSGTEFAAALTLLDAVLTKVTTRTWFSEDNGRC